MNLLLEHLRIARRWAKTEGYRPPFRVVLPVATFQALRRVFREEYGCHVPDAAIDPTASATIFGWDITVDDVPAPRFLVERPPLMP